MNEQDTATRSARERVVGVRNRIRELDSEQLELIFLEARTFNAWQDKKVEEGTLRRLYEIMISGPTHANSLPIRIKFVTTPEAKARLIPLLHEPNRAKSMVAPVNAIIGYDVEFYTHFKRIFPIAPQFADMYASNAPLAERVAIQSGTLQGAYLIIAARALGLDCGPMGGFDNEKVDAEFFAGTTFRSNFVCNIGYGDTEGVFPRLPRFAFDETCEIL